MSHFDQQPIEATALLLAAEAARAVTGSARYEAAMERSYAVPRRQRSRSLRCGPCGALRPRGVGSQPNEGAESTLMWLTAAEHIRASAMRSLASRHGPSCSPRRPDDPTDPLFRRDAANPILTAADVPYPANSVFNPAAARVDDETILLVRVEDLRGISQLHVARSPDGVTDWRFDPEPAPGRRRSRSGGNVGLRGSAGHVAPGARGVGNRLHRVQPAGVDRSSGLRPRAISERPLARGGRRQRTRMRPCSRVGSGGRWAMIHRPRRSAAARTCGCRTHRTSATGATTGS